MEYERLLMKKSRSWIKRKDENEEVDGVVGVDMGGGEIGIDRRGVTLPIRGG